MKQESYFTWSVPKIIRPMPWLIDAHAVHLPENDYYSAFTVAELGEMLGIYCHTEKTGINTDGRDWEAFHPSWEDKIIVADTEADARAKMLIYLLENKLITL